MSRKITTISDFIRELENLRDKEGDLPIIHEGFDDDSSNPEYCLFDGLDDCEVVDRAIRKAPLWDSWAPILDRFMAREGLKKALILK